MVANDCKFWTIKIQFSCLNFFLIDSFMMRHSATVLTRFALALCMSVSPHVLATPFCGLFIGSGIVRSTFNESTLTSSPASQHDTTSTTRADSQELGALLGIETALNNGMYFAGSAFYQYRNKNLPSQVQSVVHSGDSDIMNRHTSTISFRVGYTPSSSIVFFTTLGATFTQMTGAIKATEHSQAVAINKREWGISPGAGISVAILSQWEATIRYSHSILSTVHVIDSSLNSVSIHPHTNQLLIALSRRFSA